MTYPRLRTTRRYRNGAWRSCIIGSFLVLVLVCIIRWSNRLFQEGRHLLEEEEEAYPGSFLDLWPDDKNTEQYRRSFQDCFPEYYYDEDQATKQEHVCPVRLQKDTVHSGQPTIQRVALARPPGRIGDVFVEFVTRMLRIYSKNTKAKTIELVPVVGHSQDLFDNNNFSMIIRLATLPVGLEAANVALTLLANDVEKTQNLISMDYLMELMRYEIRWQCHINQMVSDNDMPLMTLTLDRFMGFPSITTRKLQKFLGLKAIPKAKQDRIEMEDLPVIVMDLVNTGSGLFEGLARKHAENAPSFMVKTVKAMNHLVEEEVKASLDDNHPCLPLPHLKKHLLEGRYKELTQ